MSGAPPSNDADKPSQQLRAVRIWVAIFIVGLVLSGVTAFPLQTETGLLVRASDAIHLCQHAPSLYVWIKRVALALADTNLHYPFLAYGTDWLAFGHLVIAVVFIGAYRDPVRNKWLITFGLIACAGVIPLALIAGAVRGIPLIGARSTVVSASSAVFPCSSAGTRSQRWRLNRRVSRA